MTWSIFDNFWEPFWRPKMEPCLHQQWPNKCLQIDPKTNEKTCQKTFVYQNTKNLILLYSTMDINDFEVLRDLFLALVGAILVPGIDTVFASNLGPNKLSKKGTNTGPEMH